jgi:hypothetical protein
MGMAARGHRFRDHDRGWLFGARLHDSRFRAAKRLRPTCFADARASAGGIRGGRSSRGSLLSGAPSGIGSCQRRLAPLVFAPRIPRVSATLAVPVTVAVAPCPEPLEAPVAIALLARR